MKIPLAVVLGLILSASAVIAAERPIAEAVASTEDVSLQTDPTTKFWSEAHPVYLDRDHQGQSTVPFRAEVRARWTKQNLYLLFVCPYDELNLRPLPTSRQETNELWKWDVAEVFIGTDFHDIGRYKEFEVSPQGEWIDLDIDIRNPHHEEGWTWNSGFEVGARIDAMSHRWYAAMRIPMAALDPQTPEVGKEYRLNLFVSEGRPSQRHVMAWQPPMSRSFHVPERFGLLRLVGAKR